MRASTLTTATAVGFAYNTKATYQNSTDVTTKAHANKKVAAGLKTKAGHANTNDGGADSTNVTKDEAALHSRFTSAAPVPNS